MFNILHLSYTINTISNSKEFSFGRCYIYCMINIFNNNILISTNMWDQHGDIVLNTNIRDNKYHVLISKGILIDRIKFVIISSFCIGVFLANWMKRKTIRESI